MTSTFWDRHQVAEYVSTAKRAKADKRAASLAACAQDAPSLCFHCGEVRADTLLGICDDCLDG